MSHLHFYIYCAKAFYLLEQQVPYACNCLYLYIIFDIQETLDAYETNQTIDKIVKNVYKVKGKRKE